MPPDDAVGEKWSVLRPGLDGDQFALVDPEFLDDLAGELPPLFQADAGVLRFRLKSSG